MMVDYVRIYGVVPPAPCAPADRRDAQPPAGLGWLDHQGLTKSPNAMAGGWFGRGDGTFG